MRFTIAFILLFVFLGFASPVFSQRRLFAVGGLGYSGNNKGYQFQQNGEVLNTQWTNSCGCHTAGAAVNYNLGLHYRMNPVWAIETGFQWNEIDLLVHDARFQRNFRPTLDQKSTFNTSYGAEGNFDFAHVYRSPYASVFFFPGGGRFYLNAGAQFNYSAQSTHSSWTSSFDDGQTLQLNARFAPRYVSSYLETGFFFYRTRQIRRARIPESSIGCSLGIRYTFAGKMMGGDYQDSQFGNTLYTDHVSATGSYVSVSLKVGVPLLTRFAQHKRHITHYHSHHAKGKSKKEKTPIGNSRAF